METKAMSKNKQSLIEINSKTITAISNKNANIGLFVMIGKYTGLRYSSVSQIKYSDVIVEGSNYFIKVVKVKNRKTVERAKISKEIYLAILKHKKQSKFGTYIIEGRFKNKPLTIQYINRILNYYASITCHDLRRYFAVNNRLAGVSADLIQNALMHRNPATTYTYIENALTVRRLYGDKYISDYLQRNRKGVYIMKEAA